MNAAHDARVRIVVRNRKAFHEYEMFEMYEAGLVLVGTEVKSLRQSRANLSDGYAMIERGEVYLFNVHIGPYEQASRANHDPRRTRKLLLHKAEIRRLVGRVVERGLSLVPTKLYFKDGVAKVELALARGRRLYDKREAIARREQEREMEAALREPWKRF
jgi:SsrA-binding protein